MSETDASLKQKTQQQIAEAFTAAGCSTLERSAGAVNYVAIRMNDESHQNVAAIYGGQGTPASIWVKDVVFQEIKDIIKDAGNYVDDVKYTHRGFDWRVFIESPTDPLIDVIVETSVDWGTEAWAKYLVRKEAKDLRDSRREEREARMAEIKRDPFA
jgi:hypothetical protein